MRILVVEDEKRIADFLCRGLQGAGYAVDAATDGATALEFIQSADYDLLVLDIMLPDIDGLEVLSRVRARKVGAPVLILSARGTLEDRVKGLEQGADDYLVKPFAFVELLARVRALLRRASPRRAPGELLVGGVRFDFSALTATGGEAAGLTTHDILVMKVLAERPGELVRRIDIVEEVCGLDSEATLRTVDNHVVALRRAIGDDPRRPRHLHTVRGEGYRLTLE